KKSKSEELSSTLRQLKDEVSNSNISISSSNNPNIKAGLFSLKFMQRGEEKKVQQEQQFIQQFEQEVEQEILEEQLETSNLDEEEKQKIRENRERNNKNEKLPL